VKNLIVIMVIALMSQANALVIQMVVEMMVVLKAALMISLPVMMAHAFQLHGNAM
jgi:hypothetical protein